MSAGKGSGEGSGKGSSHSAAIEGAWPVLSHERTWGNLALFGTATSTSIATWCFVIGGYVAYYLGAVDGLLMMIAGGLVGILLVVLSVVPPTTKYGIDSVASSKAMLGTRGSHLGLFLLYASVVGWNCMLMIFLGRACAEILLTMNAIGEGSRGVVEIGFGLLGLLTVWYSLRKGPQAMKNLGPWIAISVLILGTVIIVLLFTELGWNRIADAPPIAASDSKLWNFTTGFELLAATALAWWPYSGGMVRLTSGGRGAMWPLVCGLAIPTALVSTIGLWSALALPETGGDPTVFLVDLGGVWVGIVSLAFIVLANIGTTMVGIYVTAVGLRQVPAIERTPWSASTAMGLVPVGIVLVVTPDWVFDNIGTFLGFMGVVFAPMCAIQAVDYFVFRRKTLNVRGLYVSGKGTPYHFWGGFNLVGLFALASGCVTYLYLLDPVKYTSRSPYEYMSASLPAAFVAAVVYAVLTKLIVIPSGRGDYPQDATAEPAGEQVLAGAASR